MNIGNKFSQILDTSVVTSTAIPANKEPVVVKNSTGKTVGLLIGDGVTQINSLQLIGKPTDLSDYYTEGEVNLLLNNKIETSEKGANNGVATLDSTGKLIRNQLPIEDIPSIIDYTISGDTFSMSLTRALASNNVIRITKGVYNLSSDFIVDVDKSLIIERDAILSGTGKLLIKGKLIAGAYKIAEPTFNLRIRPSSTNGTIYPEWFGAVTMDNPRLNTFGVGCVNSTAAFKKVVDCVETVSYGNDVWGAECIMSGFYAINDQITLNRRSVKFVGSSQAFYGCGFRWIGLGDSAKSVLKFIGSDFAGAENLTFISDKTENSAQRLRAAIEVTHQAGAWTQRGLKFINVNIGDMVGAYVVPGAGFAFEHGIYNTAETDGGIAGNNDFFIIQNFRSFGARVGIRVGQDQSVDWRIDSYIFGDGDIMYWSDEGGSFTGDTWYAAANTYEGIIYAPSTISRELRFHINSFSSEHLKAGYFINADCKIKMRIDTGFMAFKGVDKAGISRPKIQILKGNCIKFDSEFTFDRIRFADDSGASKFTFETLGTSSSKRSIRLIQCSDIGGLYFDFGVYTTSPDITVLELTGCKELGTNLYPTPNKIAIVKCTHPKVSGGLLRVIDLLDGVTDMAVETLNIGRTGIGVTAGITVKSRYAKTQEAFVNRLTGVLPANTIVQGVSLWFLTSNYLITGNHYVTVGTGSSEEQFGRIAAPLSNVINTKPAYNTALTTAQDIVLRGFKFAAARTFTQNGTTTVTVDQAWFDDNMVGGEFRWTTGALAGTVNKIISIAPDRFSAQLETIATGTGQAIQQCKIAGLKDFAFTVAYMDFGRNLTQNSFDYIKALPQETVTTV